ncbi:MAG: hypothetical protein QM784_17960 [Polyangiaceae bacterium]
MSQTASKPNPASRNSIPPDSDPQEGSAETPMYAVWIALAAIVLAGLYGLRLGLDAKKAKVNEPPTSSLRLDLSPIQSAHSAGILT